MADSRLSAKRVAILGMAVSGVLAAAKISVGLMAHSTSVVADGMESAADVFTSGIVLFGLLVAARPPDDNHPYGHGRFEMLTGLGVGIVLALTGCGISLRSVHMINAGQVPAPYAIWPLLASISGKAALSFLKFRSGRRIRSAALVADAWNDTVDMLSGSAALIAVGLTLYNPSRFLDADAYGGVFVGLIVIFLGLQVVRDTALQLMDTMPDDKTLERIREVARSVHGVRAIEKCYARKTGFQYHVDLHVEVDPDLTVRASHDIATAVRIAIKEGLDWVADVMVHIEPFPREVRR